MTFRDAVVHNYRWKLLSLGLAVLTWLAINSMFQRDKGLRESPVGFTRSFENVPVTLLVSTANTNRYRAEPDSVRVVVNSKIQRDLNSVIARDIHAFVDVTDAEGERQFRRPIQIQLPMDLNVTLQSYFPSNTGVERIVSSK